MCGDFSPPTIKKFLSADSLVDTDNVSSSSTHFWHYIPEDSVRSHRLTDKSHKTASHFRCQLQAQIVVWASDRRAVSQISCDPFLGVNNCLDCSQNSGRSFTHIYPLIIKDKTRVQMNRWWRRCIGHGTGKGHSFIPSGFATLQEHVQLSESSSVPVLLSFYGAFITLFMVNYITDHWWCWKLVGEFRSLNSNHAVVFLTHQFPSWSSLGDPRHQSSHWLTECTLLTPEIPRVLEETGRDRKQGDQLLYHSVMSIYLRIRPLV